MHNEIVWYDFMIPEVWTKVNRPIYEVIPVPMVVVENLEEGLYI
jgi:hypothetical protein